MTFKLPPLPYAYDALAPHMSAETLQFHHDKHHQAYVDNGNKLVARHQVRGQERSRRSARRPSPTRTQPIINNVGQHYNHIHFWQWMKKGGGGKKLPGKLQKLVDKDSAATTRCAPISSRPA